MINIASYPQALYQKPKIRELSEQEKEEYETHVNGSRQLELWDVMQKTDTNGGIYE